MKYVFCCDYGCYVLYGMYWCVCYGDDMYDFVFGFIDQIGYVVVDFGCSIVCWCVCYEVGLWIVFCNVWFDGCYFGELVMVMMDVGFVYCGDLQIELIYVMNDMLLLYCDVYGQLFVGLYYVVWVVDDFDVVVVWFVVCGLCVVFDVYNVVICVVYFDDVDDFGVCIEVIEGVGMCDLIVYGIVEVCVWCGGDLVCSVNVVVVFM